MSCGLLMALEKRRKKSVDRNPVLRTSRTQPSICNPMDLESVDGGHLLDICFLVEYSVS